MLKVKADGTAIEKTLIEFSEGRITRQRAMYVLDVDYSGLSDLMFAHDLLLPELSDEEARVGGKQMAEFLDAMIE